MEREPRSKSDMIIDLVSRVLFPVLILEGTFDPMAKPYWSVFTISALCFLFLPDLIRIYRQSREKGRFTMTKSQILLFSVFFLCLLVIVVVRFTRGH